MCQGGGITKIGLERWVLFSGYIEKKEKCQGDAKTLTALGNPPIKPGSIRL